MDLPTDLQWRELFGVAQKIRELEPWKHFTSKELFMIERDNGDEPIFCAILGAIEGFYGISLYQGYEALNGFFNIAEAGEEPAFQTILQNQKCITAYFGELDILGSGDHTAMHMGEYTPPKGRLNQIFFRTYEPGLSPWYINREEAAFTLNYLTLFLKCYQGMMGSDTAIRPKKGEVIAYEKQTGRWQSAIRELPHFAIKKDFLEIKDELLLAKLKRLPRTAKAMELDDTFLPNPISSKGKQRPIFPRICIIADHDEGTVDQQIVLDEDEDHVDALLHLLIEALKNNGKPRLLIIRKNSTYHLLKHLCERINLPIEERTNLEIIDDFLGMIGNYNSES